MPEREARECKKHGMVEHVRYPSSRAWRCTECIRGHASKYRGANRERERLRVAQFRVDHPEYVEAEKARSKDNTAALRARRVEWIIQYFGGCKCAICGLEDSYCVFDNHHVFPTDKKISISAALTCKEKDFQDEVRKTVLLCSNCHRRVHGGLMDIPQHLKDLVSERTGYAVGEDGGDV